jgi:isoaspartyl peptidase/L-asparaginase-like protein (Ntn-hydrolase superfamily)
VNTLAIIANSKRALLLQDQSERTDRSMNMNRRTFLNQTTIGLLAASTAGTLRAAETPAAKGEVPLIVSTWPFGKDANDEALKVLGRGGSLLDAVELGIRVTESAGDGSVGLSGGPNAAGVVQLDACIMNGPDHKAGSVAALEGVRHPISAARRVMEKTRHVMLVGEGAKMFAVEEGLETVPVNSRERHEEWQKKRAAAGGKSGEPKPAGHDTIALLVLGKDGSIAGGCSTSGLGGKLPGRVGDSPILGSGLYVDNEVGAAGATGVGENVMRYCASFMIVEFMRQGMSPHEACLAVIRRIMRTEPKGADLSINFVALDKQGRYGAAGTDRGFQYSVTTPVSSRVMPNPAIGKLEQ